MSLNELLKPLPKQWCNVNCHDLNMDGSLITSGNVNINGSLTVLGSETINGSLTVLGNETITNSAPRLSIINNAVNVNRATLELKGGTNLSPITIQQDQTGTIVLENFNTNSGLDIRTNGTGVVSLIGNSYPAGPYVLGLNSSNQIVRSSVTGTFLPQLFFANASVGVTYNSQFGNYTKINNVVFFNIDVILSSKGSSVGQANFRNLPFPVSVINTSQALTWDKINFSANYTAVGTISNNVGSIDLVQLSPLVGNPLNILDDTNVQNNSGFTISGFYFSN